LQPYAYYKDQPTEFGDNLGKSYPASGNLKKNEWYNVKIRVTSNTNDKINGRIFMAINNVILIDKEIRWTTNNAKQAINKITFTTFRGGSTDEWKSDVESYVFYDNLSYRILD